MKDIIELFQREMQAVCLWLSAASVAGLVLWWLLRSATKAMKNLPPTVRVGIASLACVTLLHAQKVLAPGQDSVGDARSIRPLRVQVYRSTSLAASEVVAGDEQSAGQAKVWMTQIEPAADKVRLGIGWDPLARFYGDALYLRGTSDLQTFRWFDLGSFDVLPSETNIVAEIAKADFPEGMVPEQAFFAVDGELDTRDPAADLDGDGVTDIEEEWYGTDPEVCDSDGDGLSDGAELAYGTDPTSVDTDGDGVNDAAEIAAESDPFFPSVALDCPAKPHFEMIGTNVYTTTVIESDETSAAAESVANCDDDEVVLPGITYHEDWGDKYNRTGVGAALRALHTGRYMFKMLEADDRAHLYLNDMDLHGSWGGPKPEASTLLVAGMTYPISISSYNAGGPAELSFAKWAEYAPVPRIALDARFTKKAVIFEEAYRNSPTEFVGRKSTTTVLRIAAKGGQFGGRLYLRRNDEYRLLLKGPMDFGEEGIEIPSGDTVHVWTYPFEGVRKSVRPDDAQMILTFVENVTAETLVQTTKVTSVQMMVVAGSIKPENRKRHLFGPRETATIYLAPVMRDACWHIGESEIHHHVCEIELPAYAGRLECNVEIGQGTMFTFTMSVVAPISHIAYSYRAATPEEFRTRKMEPPLAGEVGVGIYTKLRLSPNYVCFRNIEVAEGECPVSGLTEYFEGKESVFPLHDSQHGAWIICLVDDDNKCGDDVAAVVFAELSQPWRAGGFAYAIPVYWRIKETDATWNQMAIEPMQYQFHADDSLEVKRFKCNVKRSLQGTTVKWRDVR